MASIERFAISRDKITLQNVNQVSEVTVIVELSPIWESLSKYTNTYIRVFVKLPITIAGEGKWMQYEIGNSFEVSKIQDQKVTFKITVAEKIDISRQEQMEAQVHTLYYDII
ncbi:hypothetical protein [Cellulosilyticum ruminicola]|uniref:hypothetical protein n=1 Tax=Cellulosilyticum ruminicola TaxID=425254 RepID=UPI0006CFD9B5|nr:hypothetical protein [Cellulosilyticum ruminicola]